MPYISLDPNAQYDYRVDIKPDSGDNIVVYANKVSGGGITFEGAERYVPGKEFKVRARGRKSVAEVTIEHGLYPLTTAETGASDGSKSMDSLVKLADLENTNQDRFTMTVTNLNAADADDQKVAYNDCQITGIETGDYDAQADSVVIYSLTIQPSGKKHSKA